MRKTKKHIVTTVKCKCVTCGHVRNIGPGDVPEGYLPMCDKCWSPMVAVSAKQKAVIEAQP